MDNKMILNDDALRDANGGAAIVNRDTGKYVFYTVVRGDCLSMIAARFNTTTNLLHTINWQVIGPNANLINPGMVLRIPVL